MRQKRSNYQFPKYLSQRGENFDLFLLIVEGRNTEKIYFDKLKNLRERHTSIRIKTMSADGGDIEKMLNIARDHIKKSRNSRDFRNAPIKKAYIVIDRDRFANSVYSGIGLESLRNGLNSIGAKEPIEIVISAPSFEYWYLLHLCDNKPGNYDSVIRKLEGFLKEKISLVKISHILKGKRQPKRCWINFW